ncbi:MAG: DUF2279 domain-containing protein [Flavobacteriales bacterium]|nr:DUF2279 domain-containing protein [Bacteroidota bacterium]MCB9241796.1 DUF2279 domain-containing protein [Flavobacteriales bacterium]
MRGLVWITILFIGGSFPTSAQSDSISYSRRKTWVLTGNAVAYASAMTGLYSLWYKDYPLTRFHWYNDNHEFFQMDKVGHAYSCYYEGVVGIDQMKWAGFGDKTAKILGGSYGFLIQTGVEVFDGFSEKWGASSGDMLANVAGAGLVVGQALAWDEQRFWLKLSYQPTHYPAIRPELLGSNQIERLFKDYNGQTYWLSGNVASFLKDDSRFPKWLNLAVGYGIDGFVSADDNFFLRDNVLYDYTHIRQQRQWYFSPDIDLTRIPVKRKAWKISLRLLNCLKFPLPGLAYNGANRQLQFHWLQF